MAMPPSPKKSFKFVDVSPPEADDQLLVPKEKKKIKPKPRPEKKKIRPKPRPEKKEPFMGMMDRKQLENKGKKRKSTPQDPEQSVPDIRLPPLPPRGLIDPKSVVPAKFSEGGRPGDVRDDPSRGKTY